MTSPGFCITHKKGFHITFANGWTVSVQFGPGCYCANREMPFDEEERAGAEGSFDAEVAAWPAGGELIDLGSDTVRGWQTPKAVLALLVAAENGDLAEGKIPPEERSA